MKKFKRIHPEDIQHIREVLFIDLKNYLENNVKSKWLRSKETCKQLGISDSTLKQFRNSNRITFSRIGKVYYYNIEDINYLLEQNKVDRLNI
ncbi:helix-turn-helix domain-containing protein [Faecalibacter bovis]|uniref:Helix-turn-helix domain-containing protein n=1 Tax=Faecalibacter bovis TaxID=2898187 RepID=A0ABX7XFY8_9FLAO|nr:helix-turn-helix domain-containing protein [Faecalibacter bovis]